MPCRKAWPGHLAALVTPGSDVDLVEKATPVSHLPSVFNLVSAPVPKSLGTVLKNFCFVWFPAQSWGKSWAGRSQ